MANRTLRLLITEECNRDCEGCCNKDWDLKSLPVCKDFKGYDEILLTGGEPLLRPYKITNIIYSLKYHHKIKTPVYVYTAKTDDIESLLKVVEICQGITVTLHEQNDVENFYKFDIQLKQNINNDKIGVYKNKSLRLNVFKGVDIDVSELSDWKIKDNIEWIKDCPLPENETFMRI